MCDNALKDLEVGGEGLACAAGVVDCHSYIPACSQGESHCHSVVIVGINIHARLECLGWGDDAVIVALFYLQVQA